jgi:hypothetical protein
MSGYLDLERRFGQLTEYSVDKLLATDVISRKRISWEQLLEERFSLITARANFGKTQELRASTRRLQKNGRHAVFISLHRLLAESDFEVALEPSDATAYRAWKSDLEAPLFLFVDSIDEAVLGRESGLQSALRRVTHAMGDRLNQVSWILTSRPATLTPAVLDVIQAELDVKLYLDEAEESVAEESLEDMPSDDDAFSGLSSLDSVTTVKAVLVSKARLKLYRLLPLSTKAAKFYLESSHSIADGKALLDAAWRFGLGDLTEGPGSLDILAYVDPVTNPPGDLTSIFETMIAGVQAQQRKDHREKIVGLSCTKSLDEALEKLAGASAICQLPNLELSTDALKLQEGVLSTRPLVGGLLSESELQYLLGSRVFIDSGYHQVKIYPEQLLPHLAAKRLSARVNSPEDARRLVAELSWKSITGECGVRSAYLWAYATTQHADIKAVVFDFAEGRSGQNAKAFLEGWGDTLICDDYQGYKALIKDNQITEAACMAHARRKFFELFAANKSHIAQAALEQFNAIYAVEAQLQDMPPDERQHRRQAEIKPLMDKLRQWLLDHKIRVPDGSGTMKAIDYSLKRWDALTTFLDDPHTPIDNNWVENQIRPIAVGRKNWLFAGSLRSGQRNAAIMSLVQSARLNGLNPLVYLKDVMDRLPTQPYSRINELLPHNWKPASASIES